MKISQVIVYPVINVRRTGTFLRLTQNAKIKVYHEYMGAYVLQALVDGLIFEHHWGTLNASILVERKLSKEKGLDVLNAKYHDSTLSWEEREKIRVRLNELRDEISKTVDEYMERLKQNFIRAIEKRGFIAGSISGIEVFEPPREEY